MCLENKTKFFFEKLTESSDQEDLLDITQNVSKTKENHDLNQLTVDIKKLFRNYKLKPENEIQIHVRRGFYFADFLNASERPETQTKRVTNVP